MVKRPVFLLALVLILGAAAVLPAQQSWEGLATVGSFGRFPAGLYGASNLVSPNTLVSVRNLETGVAERIIITDTVDEPGVFLILSPESATLLNISVSGATRVRLTTIVTGTTPVDAAGEQPFHPDPDINPAASTLLEEALAVAEELFEQAAATETDVTVQVETEVAIADATDATVDETPADEPVADESAEEETGPDEVVVEPETEVEPEEETEDDKPVKEPDAVEVADTELTDAEEPADAVGADVVRTGITAGVARTSVGQAQESFERPEPTLETEKPDLDKGVEVPMGEPVVPPDETATAGLPAPEPDEAAVTVAAAEPTLPAEESTLPAEPEEPAVSSEPPELVVAEEPAEPESNPIQDAVSAALSRIPARDFFPPAVGDETDLGFATTMPSAIGASDVALAEAEAPPVDEPQLAGLAPLQAETEVLPSSFAEAALPPDMAPDYAAYAAPDAPSSALVSPNLAVALAEDQERPLVQDLARSGAPAIPLSHGGLAQAAVAPEEPADVADVGRFAAPGGAPVSAELARALVEDEEIPELADVGRTDAPGVPDAEPSLAEAVPAAEELADVADVGRFAAPGGAPVSGELARALVEDEEIPELADVGRTDAPGVPDAEPSLAEAVPATEELADVAGMGPFAAPGGAPVDGELARALVADEEIPELADVGRSDAPGAPDPDPSLAEAALAPEEMPEDGSVGVVEAPSEEPLSADLVEAELAGEEVLVAEEGIESPGEIPSDALLTLEPADFRPPEYPGPDEELVLDREEPGEEPAIAAALDEPETVEPLEVVERADVEPVSQPEMVAELVEVAEPAEEIVVEDKPAMVARVTDVPVVSELVDNNYYLQIGAYTAPATAQVAVDALATTYPMAVMPIDSHGTTVYRVLVGPLEQDETGTLLLFLRARGYRDTFIRSGREL